MVGSETFDVVIVGAGAAGCVVARRLAATDASVLLLEAGPDLRGSTSAELRDGWTLPTIPTWGFESEPDPAGSTHPLRRGRLVGGTSWLTRFAVRGTASDFDGWAARGLPTWAFDHVLPVFRRIEADSEYGVRPWHGDDGPMPITRYPEIEPAEIHAAALGALRAVGFPDVEDHNAPDAAGVGRMPFSAREGLRVTTADGFLSSASPRPNLTLRAETPVASIVIESGRATGVRLIDGTRIDARHVALTAGVYGSPAILLRSGIGPSAHLDDMGIDVVVELDGVGSNLADHPAIEVDAGWHGSAIAGPLLHSIATFRSSLAGPADPPDLMIWIADPAGDEPSFEFEGVLMKPASRGTVRLRSADPTASPRITLPGVRDARDVERLAEAYRLCVELAQRPEVRGITKAPSPKGPDEAGLRRTVVDESFSIPHTVGTCPMGASPTEGAVVDALGRVLGVDGLSVIDASIIPEPTAGFPHLVTIMLADRLGEALAATV